MDDPAPVPWQDSTCLEVIDKEDLISSLALARYQGADKPLLSEYHVFGIPYDVMIIVLAWTLALSFVTKTLKEIAVNLHSRRRSWFCAGSLSQTVNRVLYALIGRHFPEEETRNRTEQIQGRIRS